MLRVRGSVLAVALVSALFSTMAHADEAVYSSFQSEMSSILDVAKAKKRLVTVYAGEHALAGVVIEIMPDAVILKGAREQSILIRVDRIDAIGWDAPASYKPSR